MSITDIIQLIQTLFSNQDLIVKIILIVLLSLYVLFAIIVSRQIFVLNEIVNQISFSPIFKILSVIHVIIAILLLVSNILNI